MDCGNGVDPGSGNFIKAMPSAVGIDDNILSCSPTSENAIACWRAAAPSSVLCYFNPWTKRVVQIPVVRTAPSVRATARPQPIGIRLSDGASCSIEYNGTHNPLATDLSWVQTYGCNSDESVFAYGTTPGTYGDGLDTSTPLWTVQVAKASGAGPLHTLTVTTAYFLGTQGA